MAKKKNVLGSWAFLAGVILAVIISFWVGAPSWTVIALVVIGLLVGILNVADTEVTPFLMSGAVLIIASALGQNSLGGIAVLAKILDNLLVVFVPATIIVALKNVFAIARD